MHCSDNIGSEDTEAVKECRASQGLSGDKQPAAERKDAAFCDCMVRHWVSSSDKLNML